jgi:hypothetical protein
MDLNTSLANLPIAVEAGSWSKFDHYKVYVQMSLELKSVGWDDKKITEFLKKAYNIALAEVRTRDLVIEAQKIKLNRRYDDVCHQPGNGAPKTKVGRVNNKLIPISELVKKNDIYLSSERIEKLADQGYMPCWYVDGNRLYSAAVVKKWIAANLIVEDEGCRFPENLVIGVTRQRRPDYGDIPDPLKPIHRHLHQMPLWSPSGVYFLVENNEVVYVGASSSVVKRIPNHMSNKRFSQAFFIPLPEEQILDIERSFIRVLKPRYNGDADGCGYSGPEPSQSDHDVVESFYSDDDEQSTN